MLFLNEKNTTELKMLHWGSMLTILSTGKVARPAFILIRTIECKFLMSSCQGYPTHFFTNRKLMLSTFFENCCVKCHEFYCCCQAVSKSTKHPHLKPHFAVKRFCGIFHHLPKKVYPQILYTLKFGISCAWLSAAQRNEQTWSRGCV